MNIVRYLQYLIWRMNLYATIPDLEDRINERMK